MGARWAKATNSAKGAAACSRALLVFVVRSQNAKRFVRSSTKSAAWPATARARPSGEYERESASKPLVRMAAEESVAVFQSRTRSSASCARIFPSGEKAETPLLG